MNLDFKAFLIVFHFKNSELIAESSRRKKKQVSAIDVTKFCMDLDAITL